MPTNVPQTTLVNPQPLGTAMLSEALEQNMIAFLDWGFLNIGNFVNVSPTVVSGTVIDQVGPYNSGVFTQLQPTIDSNYPNAGYAWNGFRGNWVWESGLSTTTQPIKISGVWVDGVFRPLPAAGGAYAGYVNYPDGQVIFTRGIGTPHTVQAQFSYKYVSFYSANLPFFNEVMFNSWRTDDSSYAQIGSGSYDTVVAQSRVNLPVVFVEVVPKRRPHPYALGGGEYILQDVLCHVIAENRQDRNNICDYLCNQYQKSFWLYDINKMAQSGAFPLDYRGTTITNPLCYPDLVSTSGYYWRNCYVFNVDVQDYQSRQPAWHRGTVRMTIRVNMGELT